MDLAVDLLPLRQLALLAQALQFPDSEVVDLEKIPPDHRMVYVMHTFKIGNQYYTIEKSHIYLM